MKDINFSDYKKNSAKKAKSDTGKIPISRVERELIERRNQERYEQIIRNQQKTEYNSNRQFSSDYSDIQTDYRNRKSPEPPKKKSGCTNKFLALILVVILLFCSTVGYVYYLCSKMQYEPANTFVSINLSEISQKNSDVYNILLIGTDKVEDGLSRSDTMMLVSINKASQTIKLTSFMRDLWVEIPGYSNARLNSAYTKGGASLLMETIEYNFDVNIDNYLLVDFEMFEKLIDAIGGVTVEITEKEADFINKTTHAKVNAGTNTLNGDYALIYCRIRKLDSDFMRTQRQRKVISAIIEQVKSQNILKTASAASEILPLVTTDISPLKMTLKLFSAVAMLDYTAEQLRIPVDGTYSNKTINGQAVLVPDYDENTGEIQEFIYG